MSFKKIALATVASVFVASSAQAALMFTATSAVNATTSPFALADFGNANTNVLVSTAPVTSGGATITFAPNAASPMSGVYDGTTGGATASAFSKTNLPSRNYLVAEPSDPVNFAFSTTQTQFQLLWGTVDTYNTLTFNLVGGGTASLTGAQIQTALGTTGAASPTPAFVTITGISFNSLVANSSQIAFEFVPGSTSVPEPASIALLGAGLTGIGMLRRRRANKAG